LEQRRDEGVQELRSSRDGIYRDMLDGQRDNRAGLRARRKPVSTNALFLERMQRGSDGGFARDVAAEFREAAEAATARKRDAGTYERGGAVETRPAGRPGRHESGTDVGARMAESVGMGLISLFESVADGVMGPPRDLTNGSRSPDRRKQTGGQQ